MREEEIKDRGYDLKMEKSINHLENTVDDLVMENRQKNILTSYQVSIEHHNRMSGDSQ